LQEKEIPISESIKKLEPLKELYLETKIISESDA